MPPRRGPAKKAVASVALPDSVEGRAATLWDEIWAHDRLLSGDTLPQRKIAIEGIDETHEKHLRRAFFIHGAAHLPNLDTCYLPEKFWMPYVYKWGKLGTESEATWRCAMSSRSDVRMTVARLLAGLICQYSVRRNRLNPQTRLVMDTGSKMTNPNQVLIREGLKKVALALLNVARRYEPGTNDATLIASLHKICDDHRGYITTVADQAHQTFEVMRSNDRTSDILPKETSYTLSTLLYAYISLQQSDKEYTLDSPIFETWARLFDTFPSIGHVFADGIITNVNDADHIAYALHLDVGAVVRTSAFAVAGDDNSTTYHIYTWVESCLGSDVSEGMMSFREILSGNTPSYGAVRFEMNELVDAFAKHLKVGTGIVRTLKVPNANTSAGLMQRSLAIYYTTEDAFQVLDAFTYANCRYVYRALDVFFEKHPSSIPHNIQGIDAKVDDFVRNRLNFNDPDDTTKFNAVEHGCILATLTACARIVEEYWDSCSRWPAAVERKWSALQTKSAKDRDTFLLNILNEIDISHIKEFFWRLHFVLSSSESPWLDPNIGVSDGLPRQCADAKSTLTLTSAQMTALRSISRVGTAYNAHIMRPFSVLFNQDTGTGKTEQVIGTMMHMLFNLFKREVIFIVPNPVLSQTEARIRQYFNIDGPQYIRIIANSQVPPTLGRLTVPNTNPDARHRPYPPAVNTVHQSWGVIVADMPNSSNILVRSLSTPGNVVIVDEVHDYAKSLPEFFERIKSDSKKRNALFNAAEKPIESFPPGWFAKVKEIKAPRKDGVIEASNPEPLSADVINPYQQVRAMSALFYTAALRWFGVDVWPFRASNVDINHKFHSVISPLFSGYNDRATDPDLPTADELFKSCPNAMKELFNVHLFQRYHRLYDPAVWKSLERFMAAWCAMDAIELEEVVVSNAVHGELTVTQIMKGSKHPISGAEYILIKEHPKFFIPVPGQIPHAHIKIEGKVVGTDKVLRGDPTKKKEPAAENIKFQTLDSDVSLSFIGELKTFMEKFQHHIKDRHETNFVAVILTLMGYDIYDRKFATVPPSEAFKRATSGASHMDPKDAALFNASLCDPGSNEIVIEGMNDDWSPMSDGGGSAGQPAHRPRVTIPLDNGVTIADLRTALLSLIALPATKVDAKSSPAFSTPRHIIPLYDVIGQSMQRHVTSAMLASNTNITMTATIGRSDGENFKTIAFVLPKASRMLFTPMTMTSQSKANDVIRRNVGALTAGVVAQTKLNPVINVNLPNDTKAVCAKMAIGHKDSLTAPWDSDQFSPAQMILMYGRVKANKPHVWSSYYSEEMGTRILNEATVRTRVKNATMYHYHADDSTLNPASGTINDNLVEALNGVISGKGPTKNVFIKCRRTAAPTVLALLSAMLGDNMNTVTNFNVRGRSGVSVRLLVPISNGSSSESTKTSDGYGEICDMKGSDVRYIQFDNIRHAPPKKDRTNGAKTTGNGVDTVRLVNAKLTTLVVGKDCHVVTTSTDEPNVIPKIWEGVNKAAWILPKCVAVGGDMIPQWVKKHHMEIEQAKAQGSTSKKKSGDSRAGKRGRDDADDAEDTGGIRTSDQGNAVYYGADLNVLARIIDSVDYPCFVVSTIKDSMNDDDTKIEANINNTANMRMLSFLGDMLKTGYLNVVGTHASNDDIFCFEYPKEIDPLKPFPNVIADGRVIVRVPLDERVQNTMRQLSVPYSTLKDPEMRKLFLHRIVEDWGRCISDKDLGEGTNPVHDYMHADRDMSVMVHTPYNIASMCYGALPHIPDFVVSSLKSDVIKKKTLGKTNVQLIIDSVFDTTSNKKPRSQVGMSFTDSLTTPLGSGRGKGKGVARGGGSGASGGGGDAARGGRGKGKGAARGRRGEAGGGGGGVTHGEADEAGGGGGDATRGEAGDKRRRDVPYSKSREPFIWIEDVNLFKDTANVVDNTCVRIRKAVAGDKLGYQLPEDSMGILDKQSAETMVMHLSPKVVAAAAIHARVTQNHTTCQVTPDWLDEVTRVGRAKQLVGSTVYRMSSYVEQDGEMVMDDTCDVMYTITLARSNNKDAGDGPKTMTVSDLYDASKKDPNRWVMIGKPVMLFFMINGRSVRGCDNIARSLVQDVYQTASDPDGGDGPPFRSHMDDNIRSTGSSEEVTSMMHSVIIQRHINPQSRATWFLHHDDPNLVHDAKLNAAKKAHADAYTIRIKPHMLEHYMYQNASLMKFIAMMYVFHRPISIVKVAVTSSGGRSRRGTPVVDMPFITLSDDKSNIIVTGYTPPVVGKTSDIGTSRTWVRISSDMCTSKITAKKSEAGGASGSNQDTNGSTRTTRKTHDKDAPPPAPSIKDDDAPDGIVWSTEDTELRPSKAEEEAFKKTVVCVWGILDGSILHAYIEFTPGTEDLNITNVMFKQLCGVLLDNLTVCSDHLKSASIKFPKDVTHYPFNQSPFNVSAKTFNYSMVADDDDDIDKYGHPNFGITFFSAMKTGIEWLEHGFYAAYDDFLSVLRCPMIFNVTEGAVDSLPSARANKLATEIYIGSDVINKRKVYYWRSFISPLSHQRFFEKDSNFDTSDMLGRLNQDQNAWNVQDLISLSWKKILLHLSATQFVSLVCGKRMETSVDFSGQCASVSFDVPSGPARAIQRDGRTNRYLSMLLGGMRYNPDTNFTERNVLQSFLVYDKTVAPWTIPDAPLPTTKSSFLLITAGNAVTSHAHTSNVITTSMLMPRDIGVMEDDRTRLGVSTAFLEYAFQCIRKTYIDPKMEGEYRQRNTTADGDADDLDVSFDANSRRDNVLYMIIFRTIKHLTLNQKIPEFTGIFDLSRRADVSLFSSKGGPINMVLNGVDKTVYDPKISETSAGIASEISLSIDEIMYILTVVSAPNMGVNVERVSGMRVIYVDPATNAPNVPFPSAYPTDTKVTAATKKGIIDDNKKTLNFLLNKFKVNTGRDTTRPLSIAEAIYIMSLCYLQEDEHTTWIDLKNNYAMIAHLLNGASVKKSRMPVSDRINRDYLMFKNVIEKSKHVYLRFISELDYWKKTKLSEADQVPFDKLIAGAKSSFMRMIRNVGVVTRGASMLRTIPSSEVRAMCERINLTDRIQFARVSDVWTSSHVDKTFVGDVLQFVWISHYTPVVDEKLKLSEWIHLPAFDWPCTGKEFMDIPTLFFLAVIISHTNAYVKQNSIPNSTVDANSIGELVRYLDVEDVRACGRYTRSEKEEDLVEQLKGDIQTTLMSAYELSLGRNEAFRKLVENGASESTKILSGSGSLFDLSDDNVSKVRGVWQYITSSYHLLLSILQAVPLVSFKDEMEASNDEPEEGGDGDIDGVGNDGVSVQDGLRGVINGDTTLASYIESAHVTPLGVRVINPEHAIAPISATLTTHASIILDAMFTKSVINDLPVPLVMVSTFIANDFTRSWPWLLSNSVILSDTEGIMSFDAIDKVACLEYSTYSGLKDDGIKNYQYVVVDNLLTSLNPDRHTEDYHEGGVVHSESYSSKMAGYTCIQRVLAYATVRYHMIRLTGVTEIYEVNDHMPIAAIWGNDTAAYMFSLMDRIALYMDKLAMVCIRKQIAESGILEKLPQSSVIVPDDEYGFPFSAFTEYYDTAIQITKDKFTDYSSRDSIYVAPLMPVIAAAMSESIATIDRKSAGEGQSALLDHHNNIRDKVYGNIHKIMAYLRLEAPNRIREYSSKYLSRYEDLMALASCLPTNPIPFVSLDLKKKVGEKALSDYDWRSLLEGEITPGMMGAATYGEIGRTVSTLNVVEDAGAVSKHFAMSCLIARSALLANSDDANNVPKAYLYRPMMGISFDNLLNYITGCTSCNLPTMRHVGTDAWGLVFNDDIEHKKEQSIEADIELPQVVDGGVDEIEKAAKIESENENNSELGKNVYDTLLSPHMVDIAALNLFIQKCRTVQAMDDSICAPSNAIDSVNAMVHAINHHRYVATMHVKVASVYNFNMFALTDVVTSVAKVSSVASVLTALRSMYHYSMFPHADVLCASTLVFGDKHSHVTIRHRSLLRNTAESSQTAILDNTNIDIESASIAAIDGVGDNARNMINAMADETQYLITITANNMLVSTLNTKLSKMYYDFHEATRNNEHSYSLKGAFKDFKIGPLFGITSDISTVQKSGRGGGLTVNGGLLEVIGINLGDEPHWHFIGLYFGIIHDLLLHKGASEGPVTPARKNFFALASLMAFCESTCKTLVSFRKMSNRPIPIQLYQSTCEPRVKTIFEKQQYALLALGRQDDDPSVCKHIIELAFSHLTPAVFLFDCMWNKRYASDDTKYYTCSLAGIISALSTAGDLGYEVVPNLMKYILKKTPDDATVFPDDTSKVQWFNDRSLALYIDNVKGAGNLHVLWLAPKHAIDKKKVVEKNFFIYLDPNNVVELLTRVMNADGRYIQTQREIDMYTKLDAQDSHLKPIIDGIMSSVSRYTSTQNKFNTVKKDDIVSEQMRIVNTMFPDATPPVDPASTNKRSKPSIIKMK